MNSQMIIKCPHCGASYYREEYRMRTSMYYPPIFKDGVNINPDGNITTVACFCLGCKSDFSYKLRYGELYNNEQSVQINKT